MGPPPHSFGTSGGVTGYAVRKIANEELIFKIDTSLDGHLTLELVHMYDQCYEKRLKIKCEESYFTYKQGG